MYIVTLRLDVLKSCRESFYEINAETFIQNRVSTAGMQWFNLPKTNMDPRLENDFKLIRMRSALDSKRHFKKNTIGPAIPVFSQVGTVIEGASEFYSARKRRKDRKPTFMEEAFSGESSTLHLKSRYGEVQQTKQSGKRTHYNFVKATRKKRAR